VRPAITVRWVGASRAATAYPIPAAPPPTSAVRVPAVRVPAVRVPALPALAVGVLMVASPGLVRVAAMGLAWPV
ncbi:MAG TPA: hypothetical protein VHA75_08145, partial [Rugosimonospora sp.]|nr:hypothetical protein [Rugosimonospora sp.]